jgi:hypothetical protein
MTLSLIDQFIMNGEVCPEFDEGVGGQVIDHLCKLGGMCIVALEGLPCPHSKSTHLGRFNAGTIGMISLPAIDINLLDE